MRKRQILKLSAIISLIILMCCPIFSVAEESNGGMIIQEVPGKGEIIEKYEEFNYYLTKSESATGYSLTAPYAKGSLDQAYLENALKALNFVRYIAGIPSDVYLDENYNSLTQASALVNAVNGGLSHFPTQPEDMDDALFQEAYSGSSQSNISSGHINIASSIINGYMWDDSVGNIPMLGHRRWVLNPAMQKVGFGLVERYSSMYSFDTSRETIPPYSYIAWPAANMPVELMRSDMYRKYPESYPWSVSLGSYFKRPDISAVTVSLKDLETGQVWEFSKETSDYNGNYFNVNNDGYGVAKCIIFRANKNEIKITAGKQFLVNIEGLQTSEGEETSLSYVVDFFSIANPIKEIIFDKTNLTLKIGNTAKIETSFLPEDTSSSKKLLWTSSDESVVTVNEGEITAIGEGTAIITAESENGITASCEVIVDSKSINQIFTDVALNAWYTDAVQFVYENDIMVGNGNKFNLSTNATRAHVMTILYRLAGEPTVTDYSVCYVLKDVQAYKWYTDSVCWAYNAGVTTGYSATKLFGVNDSLTREQLATFLYRYANLIGLDTTVRGDLSTMLNADQLKIYSKDAMEWAVGSGIIRGKESKDEYGNTIFNLAPKAYTTRAELATIMYRFCNAYDVL